MSKSMYWTKSKIINNIISEHDNIVTFLSPIGKGKFPLYVNVDNPVRNGVFTSDGTNSNAIANENLTFNGLNLYVNGGIYMEGAIKPGSYNVGQTIKTTMVHAAELNLDISFAVINKKFASYEYTPESSSSQIIVDFCAKYYIDGNATDATDHLRSTIDISGIVAATAYQQWVKGDKPGLGTRSGTIFPLMGAYYNFDTHPKLISVRIDGTNDGAIIVNNGGIWLKITEIAYEKPLNLNLNLGNTFYFDPNNPNN